MVGRVALEPLLPATLALLSSCAAPPQPRATLAPLDDTVAPHTLRCGVDDTPLPRRADASASPTRGFLSIDPLTDPRGKPLAKADADALAPGVSGLEACGEHAVPGEPPGRVTIELASSGAPLRAIADAPPSPLVRCVMERACRFHGPAKALRATLVVRAPGDELEAETGPLDRRPSLVFKDGETPESRALVLGALRDCTVGSAPPGALLEVWFRRTEREAPAVAVVPLTAFPEPSLTCLRRRLEGAPLSVKGAFAAHVAWPR